MNEFGGEWTRIKIDILVAYVNAYLKIMNEYRFLKLIYFDGFAGSGTIGRYEKNLDFDKIAGAAIKILEIDTPKVFDIYYFVEKSQKYCDRLSVLANKRFSNRHVFVVNEDCNKKLRSLVKFLQQPGNSYYRVLAFIDPYGMQVEWSS